MVRVLHIIGRMHRAGAETFIMNNYRAVNRNKVQFNFIVHTEKHMDYDDEIKALGGKIYRVTKKRNNLLKNFLEIKQIVKENNYKIIHRHTNNAYVFLDLLAAKAGGAKTLITHSHNTEAEHNFIHKVCKPFLNLLTTHRFACSDQAGKWIFNNKPFEIVKNGIKTSNFEFNKQIRKDKRKQLNLSDKFVIGHIGRFNKQKNHMFLLEIFKTINNLNNNAVLLLVGDGEMRKKIEEKISREKLNKKVALLGIRSDVPELLQAMDIFLFPSLYEGLPVTLIEAQAAGLPCVISDTISNQINITSLIEPVSLKDSALIWAKKVLNHRINEDRPNTDKIIKAGYNIQKTAEMLEEFYLKQRTDEGK